eukprot:2841314-Ditylum_brightwellii.AAC.1
MEKAADLCNQVLLAPRLTKSHQLGVHADNPPPINDNAFSSIPTTKLEIEIREKMQGLTTVQREQLVSYIDIYVDDFCLLAQDDADHHKHMPQLVFHIICTVFRAYNKSNKNRKEPNSIKRLKREMPFGQHANTSLGVFQTSLS